MSSFISKRLPAASLAISIAVSILDGSLNCMESFPVELKRHITSLYFETVLGYEFSFFKRIVVKGRVNSIAFSPDGKTVLSGSFDGAACLWNIFTGERLSLLYKDIQVVLLL